ncbi:unnamed protein product, partial [Amoebophrya sp. A25]
NICPQSVLALDQDIYDKDFGTLFFPREACREGFGFGFPAHWFFVCFMVHCGGWAAALFYSSTLGKYLKRELCLRRDAETHLGNCSHVITFEVALAPEEEDEADEEIDGDARKEVDAEADALEDPLRKQELRLARRLQKALFPQPFFCKGKSNVLGDNKTKKTSKKTTSCSAASALEIVEVKTQKATGCREVVSLCSF